MSRQESSSVVVADAGVARDPLTGFIPWAAFGERLGALARWSRAEGRALSLLIVDLDHFKSINDAFGHLRGDEVLREFAARAERALPAEKVPFRYGGDEFVILLPGLDEEAAARAAGGLLEQIRSEPFAGTPPLSLTISVGVAGYPGAVAEPEGLLEAADARLYAAKREGRGRVVAQAAGVAGAAEDGAAFHSRILERDREMEQLQRFLDELEGARRGVLTVQGVAGSGRSFFLEEARRAGALRGYGVLALRGQAATRNRAFGTLLSAFSEIPTLASPTVEDLECVLERRCPETADRAVLVLIDDVEHVDEASRLLLESWFTASRCQRLGVVCTVDPDTPGELAPELPLRARARLAPLSREGVRTWVRGTLQAEPTAALLRWLVRETEGLPGLAQRALLLLRERELLREERNGLGLVPGATKLRLREALAEQEAVPTNLPPNLPPMVGRQAELSEIAQRLERDRLITLLGPGGIGKTRLALQAAVEGAHRFPDGVHFVALAPLAGTEQLLPALADALGVTLVRSEDPLRQLLRALRDRRILVVLDNFEHVADAATVLAEILQHTTRLRVLVTSRERLRIRGEAVLELSGIPTPLPDSQVPERFPAVQLFAACAAAHDTGFSLDAVTLPDVVRICRAVGGIPLGIELAAALVRVLPVREIAAEMERSLDALTTTMRDTPARHRSLRAIFDYSWVLLSPEEQRALRRLSAFRGGFGREAAARVAEVPLTVLALLIDKSLVRRTAETRYEIHEIFRVYAEEKLRADESEYREVHDRHCVAMSELLAGLAEQVTGRDQSRALQLIAQEIENARAAWQWAVEHGRTADLERSLESLFHFWEVRGWYAEAERTLQWTAARLPAESELAARVLARQAFFCSRLSRFKRAKALHRRSLRILERIGAGEETALSLYCLGNIALQEGNYQSAKHLYRKCTFVYKQARNAFGLGLCMNDLGAIALSQGRYQQARRFFQRSLRIRAGLGDEVGMAKSLLNLGIVSDALGQPHDARRLFQESLKISRAIGDQRSVATALQNLGVLGRRLGEKEQDAELYAEARRSMLGSLEIYRQIGARSGISLSLYNLADLHMVQEQFAEAETLYLEALQEAAEIGATPLILSILAGLGILYGRTGREERALDLLVVALQQGRHFTDPSTRERAERHLLELEARYPEAKAAACQRAARRGLDPMLRDLLATAPRRREVGDDALTRPPAPA